MILDFIWTKIKHDLKKRLLILDEAWTLMQYPDSAMFVFSIAKRARKYYLGLTTITQDVADFLNTDHGKTVVTNSSIQILLRQHPAAIDHISDVFYLSQGEKNFLLSAGVGEGLFFAGSNHVAMKVKASEAEHMLITTNPQEVMQMEKENKMTDVAQSSDEQIDQIQKVLQQFKAEQNSLKQDVESLEWNPKGKPVIEGVTNNEVNYVGKPETQGLPNTPPTPEQPGIPNSGAETNNSYNNQPTNQNNYQAYGDNTQNKGQSDQSKPQMPNPLNGLQGSLTDDKYYEKGSIMLD